MLFRAESLQVFQSKRSAAAASLISFSQRGGRYTMTSSVLLLALVVVP